MYRISTKLTALTLLITLYTHVNCTIQSTSPQPSTTKVLVRDYREPLVRNQYTARRLLAPHIKALQTAWFDQVKNIINELAHAQENFAATGQLSAELQNDVIDLAHEIYTQKSDSLTIDTSRPTIFIYISEEEFHKIYQQEEEKALALLISYSSALLTTEAFKLGHGDYEIERYKQSVPTIVTSLWHALQKSIAEETE